MSNLVRISMSIEKPLLEKLERMAREGAYENRSEFIRDLVREHLVSQKWEEDKDSVGTITLLFNHHSPGLGERLTRVQHEFEGHVLASTHLHLDRHTCAEMIMVRGRASKIRALCDTMKRERGVLHATLSTGSTGKEFG